jgi:exodeoxyribonuclease VII large subunit
MLAAAAAHHQNLMPAPPQRRDPSYTQAMDGTGGNIPEYGVGELAGAIKRTLEGAFQRVRVRGELTEVKPYPSGHIYLSLKDENAKIESVIWKSAVSRLGLKPENGLEVIATGRVSTYGDRSKYQLIIEKLEYAGEGALLARIERLRLAMLAEGLFAPERKRALPLLPVVIGVVTSASAAPSSRTSAPPWPAASRGM